MLFNISTRNYNFLQLTALIMALSIFITTYGCHSCITRQPSSHTSNTVQATPQYDPHIIFDAPHKIGYRHYYVDSEQFGRAPWPVSPETYHYVNYPEIISYDVYTYSNQYQGFDNKPRHYFQQRLYGHRSAQQIR